MADPPFNWGIYFMLGLVYTLITGIGIYLYRHARKESAAPGTGVTSGR